LIEAGVDRVVCPGIDPTPEVAGKGVASLRNAGIQVDVGIADTTATDLNPGFFSRLTRGRPFVRSKIAVSLDGRTALANGQSQWITGPYARADVHRWRARSSAILTGVGTVLADDPSLDARLEEPASDVLQPARVVLDSELRTPSNAKVVTNDGETIIFARQADSASAASLRARGVSIEQVDGSRRCDLEQVLNRLGELQINEVWVEAGAELNGALMREGLIDELIIYMAPQILGSEARGMFAIDEFTSLEQRISFEYKDVRRIGDDLRIIARPRTVAGP
jgi:diaminohydroxyphosphoribosylaminopyrimidine deaminase/5-amino-6-(5-phosphoribosylamino)uracil reductase